MKLIAIFSLRLRRNMYSDNSKIRPGTWTAGFVFYGTAPQDKTVFEKINAPVYGSKGCLEKIKRLIIRYLKYIMATPKQEAGSAAQFLPINTPVLPIIFSGTGNTPVDLPCNHINLKIIWKVNEVIREPSWD